MKMATSLQKTQAGYKKTDIGVIPNDWDVKYLSELFSFSGGFTASRDQLSDNGFCYLHYGDIHKSDKTFIDVSDEYADIPKLDVPLNRIPKKALLNDGDIVFVDASEDDEGASKHIVVRNVKGVTYISGLHTIVSKSKDESLDNLYKQFCFQTRNVKRQFKFYAVGTKVSGISKTNIQKIQVPVPPKPEQSAVAKVLSDIDRLISSLNELISKKQNIKQGTMQELLTGKKRLPGFNGKWEVKKLGEVAEIKTGKKNNDDKIEEGLYPFFVRSQQIERINSYSFDGEAILIPGEGNIGSIYHYINGRFDYHQRVYKISNFAEQYSGKFIYLSMSQNFNTHAMKNSVKATVDSLRLPTFQEFEIAFPPTKEEQTAIASVLSDMGAEIEQLEQKLDKYKMIKQGMMQELLTGRTRLI
jgi:type I restriction enzyme, S subunit